MLTDGLEWCGLLWCFYQLFGLSFWRHPFTAEHPLLRHWCRDTFLQTWWRKTLVYISDGLRVSTFSANVHFWVNYKMEQLKADKVQLRKNLTYKESIIMTINNDGGEEEKWKNRSNQERSVNYSDTINELKYYSRLLLQMLRVSDLNKALNLKIKTGCGNHPTLFVLKTWAINQTRCHLSIQYKAATLRLKHTT